VVNLLSCTPFLWETFSHATINAQTAGCPYIIYTKYDPALVPGSLWTLLVVSRRDLLIGVTFTISKVCPIESNLCKVYLHVDNDLLPNNANCGSKIQKTVTNKQEYLLLLI